MTLIEKLAQISMTRYGEDLSDINPTTGATRKKELYNRAPVDNRAVHDDVDEDSEVISQGRKSKVIPQGRGSKGKTKPARDETWAENCRPKPIKQEGRL